MTKAQDFLKEVGSEPLSEKEEIEEALVHCQTVYKYYEAESAGNEEKEFGLVLLQNRLEELNRLCLITKRKFIDFLRLLMGRIGFY